MPIKKTLDSITGSKPTTGNEDIMKELVRTMVNEKSTFARNNSRKFSSVGGGGDDTCKV